MILMRKCCDGRCNGKRSDSGTRHFDQSPRTPLWIYREPARAWGCKSGTSAKFRGGLRRNPRSRSAERPRYARSGPDECLKARGRVRAIGANVHCPSHRSLSCCDARRQCEKRHIALRSTKPDGSWSSMPRSRGWLMRPLVHHRRHHNSMRRGGWKSRFSLARRPQTMKSPAPRPGNLYFAHNEKNRRKAETNEILRPWNTHSMTE